MASEHEKLDYEYTTLMDMLHVSVSKHLLDEHFTLIWANDFYYDLIGYPKAEYEELYHNRPDLYYKEDQEEWYKLGAAVMSALSKGLGGYRLLTKMRRKGGEHIWVQLAATFMDEYIDGYKVSYSVMTDVNDVIQAQMEQSITYDNLPGFVGKYRVGRGLDFTLLSANDRLVKFFGEGCWNNLADSLFRRNMEQNLEIFQAHQAQIMAGEPVHFTTRMQDQFGNDAWLQINAACVGWQEGDPVYLAIYIDVTNVTQLRNMQKKLEEQAEELRSALALAERASRAKTDFLSHMSHDIRTPMNAIIGMTDIARSNMEDAAKVRECLRKISLSSQHLLGLINDVLDMSRIESGKMTVTNDSLSLPDLLENVVSIMQPHLKAKNQSFSIHLQHVCHEQFCSDALRMRQIFLNILSNASKFTPTGGSISVNVEELPAVAPGTAQLRFTFTDSGIGIKPEFLNHLFEPFSREQDSRVDKTEGSGLGMAITKKLVDLLGGEITVESRMGVGTTFRITLSLPIEEKPPVEILFTGLRVVVADDDDTMCEYMAETLGALGVQASIFRTGQEAASRVILAHEQGEDFDAVFLDWKMPQLDAPQTAKIIRGSVGRNIPILVISAYDWNDIEDEAQRSDIDGFISKPLFVSTLCRALQKYVLKDDTLDAERKKIDIENFSGKHFLLVEDNELNQEIATELLSASGAAVDCAADGMEGIEKFKASPEGYYDLLLMDVQMPVLNGYEATAQIRLLPRRDALTVPILAMTADAFAEDIVRARKAGMDGHLAKPLDAATLRREIRKALQRV